MIKYIPILVGLFLAYLILKNKTAAAVDIPNYFDNSKFVKDSQGTQAPESQLAAANDTTKTLNTIQHLAFQKWGDGAVITISSGYRSVAYNRAIGGATNSYHTKSRAIDFKVAGVNAKDVQKWLLTLMESGKIQAGGIGQGTTYTHYDNGGTARTWQYRNGNTGASFSVNLSTLR